MAHNLLQKSPIQLIFVSSSPRRSRTPSKSWHPPPSLSDKAANLPLLLLLAACCSNGTICRAAASSIVTRTASDCLGVQGCGQLRSQAHHIGSMSDVQRDRLCAPHPTSCCSLALWRSVAWRRSVPSALHHDGAGRCTWHYRPPCCRMSRCEGGAALAQSPGWKRPASHRAGRYAILACLVRSRTVSRRARRPACRCGTDRLARHGKPFGALCCRLRYRRTMRMSEHCHS